MTAAAIQHTAEAEPDGERLKKAVSAFQKKINPKEHFLLSNRAWHIYNTAASVLASIFLMSSCNSSRIEKLERIVQNTQAQAAPKAEKPPEAVKSGKPQAYSSIYLRSSPDDIGKQSFRVPANYLLGMTNQVELNGVFNSVNLYSMVAPITPEIFFGADDALNNNRMIIIEESLLQSEKSRRGIIAALPVVKTNIAASTAEKAPIAYRFYTAGDKVKVTRDLGGNRVNEEVIGLVDMPAPPAPATPAP